ncbi:MAG: CBS domain-containing protein [Mycolicibacterium sp.]|jgi:CBS domain-containing protein|uniref:putative nucleotidyltransferase substrate binding domain-containing protein n=1 Tax=Mycolicibacterium sp. TaxID=2320850 RepID=UPI000FB7F9F8|nr:putative nucleotidyltransferase substrate binding domain-containing protein [Mycolicibacterium sp.]RUP30346.1 MAG: CBS domain-containing protein [Mycolicibacterium sp.]
MSSETGTGAELAELAELLAHCPPFDALSPADRAGAVAAAQIEEYQPGDLILDAFATMPTSIGLVMSGEIDLWFDPERIGEGPADKFTRGAPIGFTSALAGRPVGPRVEAKTKVTVANLPSGIVLPAFASRSGARFLADEIAHVRGLTAAQPRYTLLSDLVYRDPLVVRADESVTALAARMTELGLPYAAVDTGTGHFGLVTDEALRRKVIGEGLPRESPANAVMDYPAITAPASMSSADALIMLLDHGVSFLLVTGDDGRLKGAVGERDFMLAPTTAGVSLNAQIRQARSIDGLITYARRVPAMLADILARGLTADRVIAVHSALIASITRRAIFLVFDHEEFNDLSIDAFTWLSLGSIGRREAVPSSDVDAAVTFADSYEDQIPRYREAFSVVGEVLQLCGIGVDAHHAFPSHPGFSRTDSQWREAAQGWLTNPHQNQGTIMASLLVDARPIFGDPALPEPARVFRDFNRHPATVELLLQDSLSRRARLLSVRDRIIGRDEKFDIKGRGLLPIVNVARWASLSVGSPELHTVDRLRVAAGSEVLTDRSASRLIEAFDALQLLRLEHQLRQIEMGQRPDDIIDLDELSPIDRSTIEQTVKEIADVQRRMGRVAHMNSGAELVRRGQPGSTPRKAR